jgi:FtsP/CotA-like multicopper oxidase with cupredoxin domain
MLNTLNCLAKDCQMKKLTSLIVVVLLIGSNFAQNILAIPDTLIGPSINLTLQNGTHQFYSGVNTNTMGANGNILGPTIILHRDSLVSINVNNQLTDTTTIHWHGLHIAPINDGGPHSTIPPSTIWNPQFTVLDKAGTYWYHPHLHMKTDLHVSKGLAGLILVRDSEEEALNLPKSYGIDEFPIVMQTKGFDSSGEIEAHTELDTAVMVNGTVDAFVDMPAQVIRLRILNGSSQRVMEVGFSDNRQFSLIGTDGGLLQGPVNLTRYRMAPGQRADVLVDLTSSLGQNFQLTSFGSELPSALYGASQPGMGAGSTSSLVGYTSNPLNGADYQLLDITVITQTATPVLTIPSVLASYSNLLEGSADITRNLTFSSAGTMGDLTGPFLINSATFDMNLINYTVPLDNIEIWSLTNQTPIAHPFHIHDVQFFILDINGSPPPPELQGLNDVVLVPAGMGNVRFIAQFSDFADDSIPFMYHCHMLTHEDMGMMGQFLVTDQSTDISLDKNDFMNISIYPNPSSNGSFNIDFSNLNANPTAYKVFSIDGQLIDARVLSLNSKNFVLDLNNNNGMYVLKIYSSNEVLTKKILIAK